MESFESGISQYTDSRCSVFWIDKNIGIRPANLKCVCDLRHNFLSIIWVQETITPVDNVKWFFFLYIFFHIRSPWCCYLWQLSGYPSLVSTYCLWSGNRPPQVKVVHSSGSTDISASLRRCFPLSYRQITHSRNGCFLQDLLVFHCTFLQAQTEAGRNRRITKFFSL